MHVFYRKQFGYIPSDAVIDANDYGYVCSINSESSGVVWREMNVVEGIEIPIDLRTRSMCVGDVVVPSRGPAKVCLGMGWRDLSEDEARGFANDIPATAKDAAFDPRC